MHRVIHPESVREFLFGGGWMVKIEAEDLGPLETLMDAAAYEKTLT